MGETARIADCLATALIWKNGEHDPEAAQLLQSAVVAMTENLPDDNGEHMLFRANLGRSWSAMGRHSEASIVFNSVLSAWRKGNVQLPRSRFYDVRPVLKALETATNEPRGGRLGLDLLKGMVAALREDHAQAGWWREQLHMM